MAYGDNTGLPQVGETVLYFLTQEEYGRYGVQSVQAAVFFVHTATCIDLNATITTKGQNPGRSVALTEQNVTYGPGPGNWCESGGYQGVIPRGSPY